MAQRTETVVRLRRKQGFLRNFELSPTQFVKPDFSAGRPGLREASSDGTPVLIKHWLRKPSVDDSDLQEIWRHELRQLQRLGGYPGAGDRIAALLSTAQDKDGFYLVLDLGQRRPLQVVLDTQPPGGWLKTPRNPPNRLRIWLNVRRLAEAMETLHSQGLLHRNLDNWSVLTSGDGEPDFQLTGFEWSMRLASHDHAAKKISRKKSDAETFDSFREDWSKLGVLAASLLDANNDRLYDVSVPASQVRDYLDAAEVRLLRQLLGKEPLDPLDGESLCRAIDEIARRLEAGIARREVLYGLVVRLGDNSRLSDAIRTASGQQIEISDVQSQLAFIDGDLGTEAMALPISSPGQSEVSGFLLKGQQLTYKISAFRPVGQEPSWDAAYCDGVSNHVPPSTSGHTPLILQRGTVQLLTQKEAGNPHSRKKFASWDALRRAALAADDIDTPEKSLTRALALSQLVELAFAVSDIYPVRVLTKEGNSNDDEDALSLVLELRADADRETLSNALNEASAKDRLLRSLVSDAGSDSDSNGGDSQGIWTLTETPSFGERGYVDSEWRFEEAHTDEHGRQTFRFSGKELPTSATDLYLVPSASAGSLAQFKRRIRALSSLCEHHELLRMLVDQRRRLLDSQDDADFSDASFAALDKAKQEALCEMTAILPLYLVQGPPGVGKTHLVKELVRRRFEDEPTTRLLLTAQSHSAVDHLLHEVVGASGNNSESEPPLIVRCRNRKKLEHVDEFDLAEQAADLIARVIKSPLAAKASPAVARRLTSMAGSPGGGKAPVTKDLKARSAFEGVVLRAANMVFATTNAPDLERLIDERGQFDWTIVEEAGKATGGELISPLLLSHRRLMIGDHKQLPPYRSDEMKAVLRSPESLKEVLSLAPSLISRSLRGEAIEDLLQYWQDSEDEVIRAIGADAVDALMMFETMIETEFDRQRMGKAGRRIARSLTLQHRMHPQIASVISRVFYDDALHTDENRAARFVSEAAPVTRKPGSKLPGTPITLVTIPDVQSEQGQSEGESLPPWSNKREVQAVEWVLEQLRAVPGTSPSLAVLSPYARQVEALRRSIARSDERFPHLEAFRKANDATTFCGTVDSFQGSEADVVVVSLVRNNPYTKPSKALGFLTDARRMNVLLSRAKHQLILVGSIDFIRSVTEQMSGAAADRYEFLRTFIQALDEGVSNRSIATVKFEEVEASRHG
ncbi:AAA domain-containing protein [Lysobacter sp. TY2-98]|uniref:AAA domain-containing protein n=1 Tax=Lysobacter sp. TY2-98 TaxID=2290922 RepID=UPI0013B35765|nr:AAA domain-containing protein [Lysobacter sp. TY2-98]